MNCRFVSSSALALLLCCAAPAVAQDAAGGAGGAFPSPEGSAAHDAAAPVGADAEAAHPPAPRSWTLAAPTAFELAPGVSASLRAPEGWVSAPLELSVPDMNEVAGSELSVSQGWSSPGERRVHARIFLACMVAPSADWVGGLESLVFERMNLLVREELGKLMNIETFGAGKSEQQGLLFEQPFVAVGSTAARREGSVRVLEADSLERRPAAVSALGRHVIGFSEASGRVMVCSAGCVQPARWAGEPCTSAMGSFALQGELGPEPTSSLGSRLAVGLGRTPLAVVGLLLGLLLMAAGAASMGRGLLMRGDGRKA